MTFIRHVESRVSPRPTKWTPYQSYKALKKISCSFHPWLSHWFSEEMQRIVNLFSHILVAQTEIREKFVTKQYNVWNSKANFLFLLECHCDSLKVCILLWHKIKISAIFRKKLIWPGSTGEITSNKEGRSMSCRHNESEQKTKWESGSKEESTGK